MFCVFVMSTYDAMSFPGRERMDDGEWDGMAWVGGRTPSLF